MAEYTKKIFVLLYCLFALELVPAAAQNDPGKHFDELPFCNPAHSDWKHKDARLVLVSTLDGRLSALSIEGGGEVAWSLETGPGAMLSSSIHQLELTNNGHWTRMIPSLSGGLYNFNGESVEAIPVTAENLLQSEFRYSDGSVISGGKESRTYGIVAHSGKIIYECSMEGCVNLTEGVNIKDDENDILVVRRQTQTVRAVEPQTGVERWNFSVAQHDIKFLNDHSPECHGGRSTKNDRKSEDFELKIIVPDGLVCAVSKGQPNKVIWKQKLHSPVVHAWQLDDGQMNMVDLFSNALSSSMSMEGYTQSFSEPPKLYIGMHNKQLYIQESIEMQLHIKRQSYQLFDATVHLPRIPWKPFPASKNALEIMKQKNSKEETALQPIDGSGSDSTTALSVLYASEYINGNGFYLFTDAEKKKSGSKVCSDEDESNHSIHSASNLTDVFNYDDDDEMPVQIIGSLWFWWKEVLVISIATALFVNLVFTQRFLRMMKYRMARQMGFTTLNMLPSEVNSSQVQNWTLYPAKTICLGSVKDSGIGDVYNGNKRSSGDRSETEERDPCKIEFLSRYLTDFEPMHRLGKGGFGVVFEARNKIDDCNYAIKRIPLPNRQESRDRVMREVKALAKLDHQNIVRYFNAWLECPPPGWQEEQDKMWMDSDLQSDSHLSFTPRDATSIDLSENSNADVRGLSKMKPPAMLPLPHKCGDGVGLDTSVWLNLSNAAETVTKSISFVSESDECSSEDECEESDSFIVFADGPKEESDANCLDEESSNSQMCGLTRDPLLRESSSPEPNLKQVVVVAKSKPQVVRKMNDTSNHHSRNRKKRKQNVSMECVSRKESLREQEKVFSSKSTRMYLYIQMQLCRKESLREWLRDGSFQLKDRKQSLLIFDQIVQAVEYVHLHGLIHRDLKPSNIFFSQDGQIKVGDFGLVTAMAETMDQENLLGEFGVNANKSQRHTAQVGTQLYMSPEQLMGKPYNYKVDIYSLGLIFFELMVPFSTQMERWRTIKDLRENNFPPNFDIDHPEEFQLLTLMLSQNPDDRPTTFGIRARPPLMEMQDASINEVSKNLHYNLPVRKDSSSSSLSQSS